MTDDTDDGLCPDCQAEHNAFTALAHSADAVARRCGHDAVGRALLAVAGMWGQILIERYGLPPDAFVDRALDMIGCAIHGGPEGWRATLAEHRAERRHDA